MKKFMNYFLSFFTIAAVLFLASCGDDGEVPLPGTITLSTADGSIDNDTLSITSGDTTYVTATLGVGNTGDIVVTTDDNSVAMIPTPNTISSGDSIAVIVPDGVQEGSMATVTFTSGDIHEQIIVTVEEPVVDVTAYSAVLLYAPTGDSTSQTFFSTSTGETYSYADVVGTTDTVSQYIDFGYFYGQTVGASLQSADDYTPSSTYDLTQWTIRNATEFRTTNLTSDDFDAITESQGNDIEAFYETGTALDNPKRVEQLAAGDVVAFTTSDSRFGLIKVVEVTGTFNQGDNIEIEVKVTNAIE